MTDQLSLSDQRPVWCDDPIGERFWAFHLAHPNVGSEFVRLARQWMDRNPGRPCGAKSCWERLRWDIPLEGLNGEPKLNNDFCSLYARWAMYEHRDLEGLFRLRERHTSRLTGNGVPSACDVERGGTLPTRWVELGNQGRVRHLIRKEFGDGEEEALCGVTGTPRQGSGPCCGTCGFRLAQIEKQAG